MNYREARAWLDQLTNSGIKLGLERPRALAAALGSPEESRPCVLIAGTNGKGSTQAFLAALLRTAGLRVGQYSSPHLVTPRERMRIDEVEITPEDFAASLSAVRELADSRGETPTHFEAVTLAAFVYFSRKPVDLVVYEVGLGGRLDCTNLVQPALSIITTIGMDHMEFLGHSLDSIAREKAGILRRRVPALTGATPTAAVAALRASAEAAGAPLEFLEAQCRWAVGADGTVAFTIGGTEFPPVRPALAGAHQLRNAALALRAAQVLHARGLAPAPPDARALALARWPGRLESRRGGALWLDGAHNPEGAAALAAFARTVPGPRRLLFGAMRDKQIAEVAHELFPAFDEIWLVRTRYARGASGAELRAAIPGEFAPKLARDFETPEAALEALGVGPGGAGTPNCVTFIAGSLFLVGECIEFLDGARD